MDSVGPLEMSATLLLVLLLRVLPLVALIWALVTLGQLRRSQRELVQRVAVLEELLARRPS
jgi:hypothetical protein